MHKGFTISITYHQLKYSSPNRSKNTLQKQEPHKRAYLLENGGYGKQRGQENGPKAEKEKTERVTGLGRRTRKGSN